MMRYVKTLYEGKTRSGIIMVAKGTMESRRVVPCEAVGKIFIGDCPPCPLYDLAHDLCTRRRRRQRASSRGARWNPTST
jgi:hypothetical protein